MSNYKDIWTKPGGEGVKFWNTVDFNHPYYKLQEQIFRQQILRYWGLVVFNKIDKFPESVLELGAGSGRMTKIMLEVFPGIKKYYIVDIKTDHTKLLDFFHRDQEVGICECDITTMEFDTAFSDNQYDFILASEVFMHIKPYHISSVIEKCSELLNDSGIIMNIDWTSAPEHSTWCYIHDYDKLYRENGLHVIFEADIPEIKQKLFCYGSGA